MRIVEDFHEGPLPCPSRFLATAVAGAQGKSQLLFLPSTPSFPCLCARSSRSILPKNRDQRNSYSAPSLLAISDIGDDHRLSVWLPPGCTIATPTTVGHQQAVMAPSPRNKKGPCGPFFRQRKTHRKEKQKRERISLSFLSSFEFESLLSLFKFSLSRLFSSSYISLSMIDPVKIFLMILI